MAPAPSFAPAALAPGGALDDAAALPDASAPVCECDGAALDELVVVLPAVEGPACGADFAGVDCLALGAPGVRMVVGRGLAPFPTAAGLRFVAGACALLLLALLLVAVLGPALLLFEFGELEGEFDDEFDDGGADESAEELFAESAARCKKPLNKSFTVVDCDGVNFKAAVVSIAVALVLLSIFAGVIIVRFVAHAPGCVSFR